MPSIHFDLQSFFPAHTNLHAFFLNLLLPCPLLPPFELQPQTQIPFSKHDHPPSTNNYSNTMLICCFIQTQHQHQVPMTLTCIPHRDQHGSLCPLCPFQNSHLTLFQAPCFTSIQICWPYIALVDGPFQL